MNHTPTPWRVVQANAGFTDVKYQPVRIQPIGLHVGDTSASLPVAEFIVRACNSHESLVAALKSVLTQANNIEVLGEWSAQDVNHSAQKRLRAQVNAIYTDARAALTAAGAA